MTTYTITELQNVNSYRKGESVEAKDLTAAKRKASRMQRYHGTVMEIAYENGTVVSVKEDGKWRDL